MYTQGNTVTSTSKTKHPTQCAHTFLSTSPQCKRCSALKLWSKTRQRQVCRTNTWSNILFSKQGFSLKIQPEHMISHSTPKVITSIKGQRVYGSKEIFYLPPFDFHALWMWTVCSYRGHAKMLDLGWTGHLTVFKTPSHRQEIINMKLSSLSDLHRYGIRKWLFTLLQTLHILSNPSCSYYLLAGNTIALEKAERMSSVTIDLPI